MELALASYPGFHLTGPPAKGTPYGVFEAAYVAQDAVAHVAVLPDGQQQRIPTPDPRVRPRLAGHRRPVARIAPVSREMVLNYVCHQTFGLPKSY